MSFEHLNLLIQQGKSQKARQELQAILRPSARVKFTRDERLLLASLCRRVGWFQGGVLVLAPLVRPKERAKSAAIASDIEKTEYASNLIQMGSRQEGRLLLREVSPAWFPKYFVEALSYFSEWDYAGAIPLLRKYLTSTDLTPYSRIIGEVNLAAAFVFENQAAEAEALLQKLALDCEKQGHSLMLGNIHEIKGQLALKQNKIVKAERHFKKSGQLLESHSNIDQIFLRKWQAILHAKQGKTSALADLKNVGLEAAAKNQWETWRDCEYHHAVLTNDQKGLREIYWGTSHRSFRQRIERETEFHESAADYVRELGPGKSKDAAITIDTWSGLEKSPLKTGQVPQRLLEILARDIFRPVTTAEIYSELFPGSFYNAESSPQSVHQALNRLRAWLTKNKVPLRIRENQSRFAIEATGAVQLRLHRREAKTDPRLDLFIEKIRNEFGNDTFSRKELCQALDFSDRQGNLILKELSEQGRLRRVGSGPQTRYQL